MPDTLAELVRQWNHREGEPDAEIIARARRVMALHAASSGGWCEHCTSAAREDAVDWPCETVRVLDGGSE